MSKIADGVVEVEKGQSKLLLATTNQAKGEGPTRDEEESSKLTWRSLRTRERRKREEMSPGPSPSRGKERKEETACASWGEGPAGLVRVSPAACGKEGRRETGASLVWATGQNRLGLAGPGPCWA